MEKIGRNCSAVLEAVTLSMRDFYLTCSAASVIAENLVRVKILSVWEGNMRPIMRRHVSIFKRLICLGYLGYLGYSRYPGYPKDSGGTSGTP